MQLDQILNLSKYPIDDADFQKECAARLDDEGVLTLPNFFTQKALKTMKSEAKAAQDQAYFCTQSHSVYLTKTNQDYAMDHPANRTVV